MRFTVREEPWLDNEPKIKELGLKSYDEALKEDFGEGDVNWELLRTLSYHGLIKLITARGSTGEIVGYGMTILSPSLYNRNSMVAELSSIFLLPEYRDSGIARKIIKETERVLKNLDVHCFTFTTRTSEPYKTSKFSTVEKRHSKLLEE